MSKPLDLVGKKFARLLVESRANEKTKHNCTKWNCVCDCGNRVIVIGYQLKNGNTKSCGCFKKEKSARLGASRRTHGKSHTRSYATWCSMKSRCFDTDNEKYQIYGARGITVCERWMNFENFYQDMGERPRGLTIERIDNYGNYQPGNCKWETPKGQANNTRRNRRITFDGETLTLTEWAKRLHINPSSMHERLAKNSVELALSRSNPQPGRCLC